MLPFTERERFPTEAVPRPSDQTSDEERCARVGRACLALLGTSTSLAGLFDALPRLLADGLGLAGVAIRRDPEPVRPLAVHDDDDPFSSAIRNAPLVLAPAESGGLAFRPSPAV